MKQEDLLLRPVLHSEERKIRQVPARLSAQSRDVALPESQPRTYGQSFPAMCASARPSISIVSSVVELMYRDTASLLGGRLNVGASFALMSALLLNLKLLVSNAAEETAQTKMILLPHFTLHSWKTSYSHPDRARVRTACLCHFYTKGCRGHSESQLSAMMVCCVRIEPAMTGLWVMMMVLLVVRMRVMERESGKPEGRRITMPSPRGTPSPAMGVLPACSADQCTAPPSHPVSCHRARAPEGCRVCTR